MKRHLNLKPYECQVCKAKFARNSTLKVHNLTHFGKSDDKDTLPTLTNQEAALDFNNSDISTNNNMILMNYLNVMNSNRNNNMYNILYNNNLINTYRDSLLYNSMMSQQQLLNMIASQVNLNNGNLNLVQKSNLGLSLMNNQFM
jgi:hypothetical protein